MDWKWATAAGTLVALAGCSSDPLPGLGAGDLARVFDGSAASPDLAGFCGNPDSPRIELNGMLAASPSVTANPWFLNCCSAGSVEFVSMQIATPISLLWEYQGGVPDAPVTMDLANLPPRWKVIVWSGCSPTQPNCQPSDSYSEGLTGTITVGSDMPGVRFQVSACVTVNEPGGMPHPVIHSLRLWTPTVSTN